MLIYPDPYQRSSLFKESLREEEEKSFTTLTSVQKKDKNSPEYQNHHFYNILFYINFSLFINLRIYHFSSK
jgi:hypothetical protein